MCGVAPPTHRQRVGSWRVMAQLEKNLIRIMRVLHRREVYERSYWARQEIPQQGDLGDRESTETTSDDGQRTGIHRTSRTTGFSCHPT